MKNAATIQSLIETSFSKKQSEVDADLKTLHVSTLIIHGGFDPIPMASSDYIRQRISASQLVVIKDSGHFPFIEQPAAFLTAVRTFLRT